MRWVARCAQNCRWPSPSRLVATCLVAWLCCLCYVCSRLAMPAGRARQCARGRSIVRQPCCGFWVVGKTSFQALQRRSMC